MIFLLMFFLAQSLYTLSLNGMNGNENPCFTSRSVTWINDRTKEKSPLVQAILQNNCTSFKEILTTIDIRDLNGLYSCTCQWGHECKNLPLLVLAMKRRTMYGVPRGCNQVGRYLEMMYNITCSGGDVNICDTNGITALHVAVQKLDHTAFELLVRRHAKPFIQTQKEMNDGGVRSVSSPLIMLLSYLSSAEPVSVKDRHKWYRTITEQCRNVIMHWDPL